MDSPTATKTACSVDAQVVRCVAICREHVLVEFELPAFPDSVPGQFLQLRCRADDELRPVGHDWPADGFPSVPQVTAGDQPAYLRRPFSIADRFAAGDGGVRLKIIARAVGGGTRWLERLGPGDTLNATGPLGSGFRLPAKDARVALVGGGVGIPPLLYLARGLRAHGYRDVTAVFGAATRDLLPVRLLSEPARDPTPASCVELPGDAPYATIVTSDDGSIGMRGMVTDALRGWCEQARGARQPAVVYACGPDGMLKAVAAQTRECGVNCQLCIERNMACGLGACLSCVVRAHDPGRAEGWRWVLTCCDGPVFDRDELLDYHNGPRA